MRPYGRSTLTTLSPDGQLIEAGCDAVLHRRTVMLRFSLVIVACGPSMTAARASMLIAYRK